MRVFLRMCLMLAYVVRKGVMLGVVVRKGVILGVVVRICILRLGGVG